jgi:hypothetical protein
MDDEIPTGQRFVASGRGSRSGCRMPAGVRHMEGVVRIVVIAGVLRIPLCQDLVRQDLN